MNLELDPTVLAYLAIGGVVLGAVSLVAVVVSATRLRRMRRTLVLLQGQDGSESFVDAVAQQVVLVEQLRSEVESAKDDIKTLRGDLAESLRHIAVVRYDAFNDMGGRMSFSVALLDDAGDGLVLTSINGRSETRTYAKGIQGGRSEAVLSPEEEQVVGYARGPRA